MSLFWSGRQDSLTHVQDGLTNDPNLEAEIEKIDRAFEDKMESLKREHCVARQRAIADARIRNGVPLDVALLMQQAEQQHKQEDSGASRGEMNARIWL